MSPGDLGPAGWPRRLLDWLCGDREDYRAFQRVKATRQHRDRRAVALYVWAGAALLMLACPAAGCVAVLLLTATFISLALLDGPPED